MNDLFQEPADQYHKWSGRYLTSHLLIEAHNSLDEWRNRMIAPREDTDAYAFGRAAHVLCMEGKDAFSTEYEVGGPINPRTKKTYGHKSKKFQDWAAEQKKECLTPEQYELAMRMSQCVHRNKAAKKLLADGEAELVGRTVYCEVPCQIRVDWILRGKWIVDYKTTSDLFSFGTSVKQYGYMYQAAFYQAVVQAITGELLPFYLIACEKSEESPCIVWLLDQKKLDAHRAENESKIAEIRSEFLQINESRPDLSLIEQSAEEFRHLVLENCDE